MNIRAGSRNGRRIFCLNVLGHSVFLLFLAACNPATLPATNRVNSEFVNQDLVGKAYIYRDNPTVLSGNTALNSPIDMKNFTDFSVAEVITTTDKTSLVNDCFFTQKVYPSFDVTTSFTDCIKILATGAASDVAVQPVNGNWVFTPNSSEFYQVNGMFHLKKITDRFLGALTFIHDHLHFNNQLSIPPVMPYGVKDLRTFWHNYNTSISQDFKTAQVSLITFCEAPNNSFYDSINNQVCIGYDATHPDLKFIQDPTMVYHEMGHSLVKIMMNLRNAQYNTGLGQYVPYLYTSSLTPSIGGYSESQSINEGIADYFSYVINERKHVFEWSAGRYLKQSRPLSEDDVLHAPGISLADDERLSYPQYLNYNPNNPELIQEDVHNAGQIYSHYLVALTDAMKNECSMSHVDATNAVLLVLAESLAERGDLLSKGTDFNYYSNVYLTNLNPNNSYDWAYIVKPVTFRNLSQLMAKNIYHHISSNLCPSFTKDKSEKLLDNYGLLLFTHYDDNGTTTDGTKNFSYFSGSNFSGYRTFTSLGALTGVDEGNRLKTTLVAKSQLVMGDTAGKSVALINDSKASIQSYLAAGVFQGKITTTSTGIASVNYNNSNGKVSPGEIVALSMNLYNQSNTAIAGVNIFANDWDHMKVTDTTLGKIQPCSYDNFPLTSEGGIAGVSSSTPGDCSYITRDAPKFIKSPSLYPADAVHPVCFVQLASNNETKWVSQDDFRKNPNLVLQDKDCLNSTSTTFNPNECLVRFLPGFQRAVLSKLDPQKTYQETLKGTSSAAPSVSPAAFLLLEVSKWIPPGTQFNCRLRVNFGNCSDCDQNVSSVTTPKDDYADFEYAGNRPYKVINFQFQVND